MAANASKSSEAAADAAERFRAANAEVMDAVVLENLAAPPRGMEDGSAEGVDGAKEERESDVEEEKAKRRHALWIFVAA